MLDNPLGAHDRRECLMPCGWLSLRNDGCPGLGSGPCHPPNPLDPRSPPLSVDPLLIARATPR